MSGSKWDPYSEIQRRRECQKYKTQQLARDLRYFVEQTTKKPSLQFLM